ncbi:MAG: hypothetical protein HRT38_02775 [Alteromonadaceae bacterium]|nr:hypothetical protein [Alteromonadaceae bacterium]
MPYTFDDLAAVRQAKLDLALGKRLKSVMVMGQDISYESCSLASMTLLESQIIKALKPRRIKHVSLQYDRGL